MVCILSTYIYLKLSSKNRTLARAFLDLPWWRILPWFKDCEQSSRFWVVANIGWKAITRAKHALGNKHMVAKKVNQCTQPAQTSWHLRGSHGLQQTCS